MLNQFGEVDPNTGFGDANVGQSVIKQPYKFTKTGTEEDGNLLLKIDKEVPTEATSGIIQRRYHVDALNAIKTIPITTNGTFVRVTDGEPLIDLIFTVNAATGTNVNRYFVVVGENTVLPTKSGYHPVFLGNFINSRNKAVTAYEYIAD